MERSQMKFIPGSVLSKTGFESIRKVIRNYLYTPYGDMLVESMLPSADKDVISQLRNQTAEVISLHLSDHQLPFFQIDEISEWLDQARPEGSVLPPGVFPAIRDHIRLADAIHRFLVKHEKEIPVLHRAGSELNLLEKLKNEIDRYITDKGTLKDDASPKLKSVRKELNQKKTGLRDTIQRIYSKMGSEGMVSDEGPTLRNGRMVIPVQAEYKRKIDGFIHDVSASGQTVYLEPAEALQINNDIRQLESEERREIERILRDLTGFVRSDRSHLFKNAEILGKIDGIQARCRAAEQWNGALPDVSSSGEIHIINGRNPVLLLKHREQKQGEHEDVVPLDLELSANETGLIISGPNAGGKSVALKTIALLACMHQCGIPVPADPDSSLPFFSGISLDMGDDQSIENDLSTFSSRLKWMVETLEMSDARSLVLIDEAGTGTDPDEGGALFQAFIETLVDIHVKTIATTHHGTLKIFAHDHPKMVNGSMEFDQQTLAPTYIFRKGIPGSSYAFEIAGRMKMPENLLQRARSLIGENRDRMAGLILDLEQKLKDAEKKKTDYKNHLAKAKEDEERYRRLSDDLETKRNAKLEEAYREAEQILKKANQKIEQAVEKITGQDRYNPEFTREVRKEISGHKKKIRDRLTKIRKVKESSESAVKPVTGDFVQLRDSDTTGELIKIESNSAVVLAGKLTIRTSLNNLVRVGKQDKKRDKSKTWMNQSVSAALTGKKTGTSLNIRGLRGDDAVNQVMHYLDNAIAAGLHEVDIIHGKGEGILKKLVHEYLGQREEVTGFELAPIERGGAGCTVVTLSK